MKIQIFLLFALLHGVISAVDDDVDDDCSVCLRPLHEDNTKVQTLPCNHALHGSCYTMMRDYGHKQCPLCRSHIFLIDLWLKKLGIASQQIERQMRKLQQLLPISEASPNNFDVMVHTNTLLSYMLALMDIRLIRLSLLWDHVTSDIVRRQHLEISDSLTSFRSQLKSFHSALLREYDRYLESKNPLERYQIKTMFRQSNMRLMQKIKVDMLALRLGILNLDEELERIKKIPDCTKNLETRQDLFGSMNHADILKRLYFLDKEGELLTKLMQSEDDQEKRKIVENLSEIQQTEIGDDSLKNLIFDRL